jgi:hypothetical protein
MPILATFGGLSARGFRNKRRIFIPGATGTPIGGMTTQGGLAAAFDGNTSQANTSSATSNGVPTGYVNNAAVGKDWGAGTVKCISRFDAWSPTDFGFLGNGAAVGYKLQGSTDNFSSSVVDLYSGTSPSGAAASFSVAAGIVRTAAYRYHRLVFNGNGVNAVFCAELKFYEDL